MSEYIRSFPGVVNPEIAKRIGKLIRLHAEGKPSVPWPIFPIRVDGKITGPDDLAAEILAFADAIEPELPIDQGKAPATAISSTAMLSPQRFFPLHRDLCEEGTPLDRRFMLNMSPEPAQILYIPEPMDTPDLTKVEQLQLEPGGGYFLDNSAVQLWHGTLPQQDRTMLQFLYEAC